MKAIFWFLGSFLVHFFFFFFFFHSKPPQSVSVVRRWEKTTLPFRCPFRGDQTANAPRHLLTKGRISSQIQRRPPSSTESPSLNNSRPVRGWGVSPARQIFGPRPFICDPQVGGPGVSCKPTGVWMKQIPRAKPDAPSKASPAPISASGRRRSACFVMDAGNRFVA